ncbi:nucleotide-binding protein [Tenacibaculum dicentrarchi]|nr:nucleotide-binding protein [Tenacibaculum dicentrarchi]
MTELIKTMITFKEELENRINKGYEIISKSHLTELNELKKKIKRWDDYNIELLKQSFNIPNNEYKKKYIYTGVTFDKKIFRRDPSEIITQTNFLEDRIEYLDALHEKSELIQFNTEEKSFSKNNNNLNQVFIVHGHDDEAKIKTARFVEKIGFEAIILHEQASSSMSIIEKIEEYSNVGFGIILYTPCDIGSKQTNKLELKSRARQNVVFEHGFLIGKIKRENVCALVKGNVELPNDISGVVYIQMDNENSWKYTIAKEMKASGYNIDMNKI